MTPAQTVLNDLKDEIKKLPDGMQNQIAFCVIKLQEFREFYGDASKVAIMFVSIMIAIEDEEEDE